MSNTNLRNKIRSLMRVKPKKDESEIERTPDGQRIYTGAMSSVDGRRESVWDRFIPYEKLVNLYTEKQVTPEQVAAAKYFVEEEGRAFLEVGKKFIRNDPIWLDDNMRSKLVCTNEKGLENMVEEHKKELSDPEYQQKKRESRKAAVSREMNEAAIAAYKYGQSQHY